MDAMQNNNDDFAVNFDLLTDDFELVNTENNSGSSEQLPESLIDLLDSINDGNQQEKYPDSEAFEEASKKQRFQVVTDKDLDDLASETNAISTHWQTNWAVNVFRGKKVSFSVNFS